MSFLIVRDDEIKRGLTTDKYFIWAEKVLREKGKNPKVVAEVTASTWGIFAGLNDVLELLKDRDVEVYAMEEGTLFFPHEPVLIIRGRYLEFARLETAILGFLCHASGVATQAFKTKLAADDKIVLSFGTRRQHPAISAMIERSAFIGGVDGVSNFSAERYLGIESVGTMPHALIICFGDQVEAWKAFDEVVDKDVPRILLIDTYCDEKSEAIKAIENLKRVDGVRLDTPSSRRGDIRKIIEEIRWELKIRGRDVRIVLSGGLSIEDVYRLKDIVDAFGVGTSIAGAPPIDFSLDIVEKEGVFCAKRGKRGGMKQVYRDWRNLSDEIKLFNEKYSLNDGEEREALIKKFLEDGRILKNTDIKKAREITMKQMRVIKEMGKVQDFIFK